MSFGVILNVYEFFGSFPSVSIELPKRAAVGITLRHIVQLEGVGGMEKPLKIFVRLNIGHWPNVEQIVHELPLKIPSYRLNLISDI